MANLSSSLSLGSYPAALTATIQLRVGRREISIGRDCRTRYYQANPLIECSPGIARGHLQILLLRQVEGSLRK